MPPTVGASVRSPHGIATAPVLTAGQEPGQIVVTASATGAPTSVALTAHPASNPTVRPARLPNLRARASARWRGAVGRVRASAGARRPSGVLRVRARVLASNHPGLLRRRVALRISIPTLDLRKLVHFRMRGKRVRTLRMAFRAPPRVVGKRVHVVVDPADRVNESNERDNAAHVRIHRLVKKNRSN
jgi:hypothetical protein